MDLYEQCPSSKLLLNERFEPLLTVLTKAWILTSDIVISTPQEIHKRVSNLTGGKLTISLNELIVFRSLLMKELNSQVESNLVNLNKSMLQEQTLKLNDLSFTTGDELLDCYLRGEYDDNVVLPLGYLIEVTGGSSCGKSHFLMQFCLTVQLPIQLGGLGADLEAPESKRVNECKAVYVSTEGYMETRRLSEMCDYYENIMTTNGIADSGLHPSTSNVLQIQCSDLETQDHIIFVQLPALLEKESGKVKLICIDSISHHIRVEFENRSYQESMARNTYLYELSRHLKRLAKQYEVCIVFSNQVSDKPITKLISNDRLAVDYQLGWMSGWSNETILYRQNYQDEIGDADASFTSSGRKRDFSSMTEEDFADEEDDGPKEDTDPDERNFTLQDELSFTEQIKLDKHEYLFGNEVTKLKETKIPALGYLWNTLIDVRIVLFKNSRPIIDENLIDSMAFDLGLSDFKNIDQLKENRMMNEGNWATERWCKLCFSPFNGYSSDKVQRFEIWKGGIRGVVN
ncbi:BA75_01844T0 [Komagataella pastoris]|uniref:BA75_01844T0 n=1 Tax=Komagataella pastoris TaxID=4922 RepID=A0A1B2J7A9_PICPA|nr:BA75_01844T0 [Komagataella pastoris]